MARTMVRIKEIQTELGGPQRAPRQDAIGRVAARRVAGVSHVVAVRPRARQFLVLQRSRAQAETSSTWSSSTGQGSGQPPRQASLARQLATLREESGRQRVHRLSVRIREFRPARTRTRTGEIEMPKIWVLRGIKKGILTSRFPKVPPTAEEAPPSLRAPRRDLDLRLGRRSEGSARPARSRETSRGGEPRQVRVLQALRGRELCLRRAAESAGSPPCRRVLTGRGAGRSSRRRWKRSAGRSGDRFTF